MPGSFPLRGLEAAAPQEPWACLVSRAWLVAPFPEDKWIIGLEPEKYRMSLLCQKARKCSEWCGLGRTQKLAERGFRWSNLGKLDIKRSSSNIEENRNHESHVEINNKRVDNLRSRIFTVSKPLPTKECFLFTKERGIALEWRSLTDATFTQ